MTMNKKEIEERLAELESIPVAEVHGGRQRSSKENEELYKLRSLLTKI